MRYEAAVELARSIIERVDIDSRRFEAEKRENPLLADHTDPVYDLYYQISGPTFPANMAELAACPDITVEIADDPGDEYNGDYRLKLRWLSPVDDTFSYVGNLGPHKKDREITGTVRKQNGGLNNKDPSTVTATFSTAELGTLYRVVIEATRTDMTWKGETYKEITYTLYVGGKEREHYSEELLVDLTPEEIIQNWIPTNETDESIPHTLLDIVEEELTV